MCHHTSKGLSKSPISCFWFLLWVHCYLSTCQMKKETIHECGVLLLLLIINFVFQAWLSLWLVPLVGGRCLDLIQLTWCLCFEWVSSKVFLVVSCTNYKRKHLMLPIHLNSGNCKPLCPGMVSSFPPSPLALTGLTLQTCDLFVDMHWLHPGTEEKVLK